MKKFEICGFEISINSISRIKTFEMSLPIRAVDVYLRTELLENGAREFHIVYATRGIERSRIIKNCKRAVLLSVDPMYIPGTDDKGLNDYRKVKIKTYR